MARNRKRFFLLTASLAAAILFSAMVATTAFAAAGDSVLHATLINPYIGSSLTTHTANGSNVSTNTGGTGAYYFKVQLSAGETFRANFVSQPGLINAKVVVLPNVSSDQIIEARRITGMTQLTFSAPRFGMYTIYLGSSTQGTFTVSPYKIGPVYYAVNPMSAPSTARPNRSFKVSADLAPMYYGPTVPIKFYVQRKVGRVWKSYSSKTASWPGGNTTTTYTKFSTTLSLPSGLFRVRAQFSDAAHKTPKYNSYKTINVR